MQLFLTGRHHIENDVQRFFQVVQEYTVVISASPQDIEAFIKKQIIRNPYAVDAMNDVLKKDIIDAIVQRSHGM